MAGVAVDIPSDVFSGYANGTTLAHEMGHATGRAHTDYNAQRGWEPKEVCGEYVSTRCQQDPPDGTISQSKDHYSADTRFGYDTRSRTIYNAETPDLMSYGRNTWPSASTDCRRRPLPSRGLPSAEVQVGSFFPPYPKR